MNCHQAWTRGTKRCYVMFLPSLAGRTSFPYLSRLSLIFRFLKADLFSITITIRVRILMLSQTSILVPLWNISSIGQ